ncbi:MAG: hypothetical protein MI746_02925 [Pseudomonadales bacterium]|nr:hypothetical protein [Pseudomonadales bacterium]
MILDAAIHSLISVIFALLLLWASLHKFSDRLQFQGILAAYQLLPVASLPLLALFIPVVELSLGLAWLTGFQNEVVALATVALLASYTFAMGINIFRGNTEIDCGCGLSSARHKTAGYQRLSSSLLLRNLILILAASIALIPSNERLLGFIDYLNVGLASVGLVFLYAAFNQLLANKNVIDSWRKELVSSGEANG